MNPVPMQIRIIPPIAFMPHTA